MPTQIPWFAKAALVVLASLLYWAAALIPVAYLFLASALGDCFDVRNCIRLENSGRGVMVYFIVAISLYVLGVRTLLSRWARRKDDAQS